MPYKNNLTLATFNLYNLQLPGKAMYNGIRYTPQQYREKLEWTANKLKLLDADIIAFQELWRPECLRDVFVTANLDDEYTLIAENINSKGMDNAIAVRKPHEVVKAEWIKNFPEETVLKKRKGRSSDPDYQISVNISRFSRAVLSVTLNVIPTAGAEPVRVRVLVAHLKSKKCIMLDKQEKCDPSIRPHATALGQAMSSIRRTAESAAIRVLVNKMMRSCDDPVIVLGDLNNTEHSVSTAIIAGQPKFYMYTNNCSASRSDRGLYSTSYMQGYRSVKDTVFTHITDGNMETLDHILVSKQFYDYSDNRLWSFNNLRCFNDYLADKNDVSSDHAIVSATFDYNPSN